ncbi:MAG TPA: 6-phosphogluconolactonase [Lysobacter sp.]
MAVDRSHETAQAKDPQPHHDLHVHANEDVWTWAAAVSIAAELRRELISHPRARLLLSGGATPVPVYQALSKAPLEWDRVNVGLVDERWLQPQDIDSNAHLVRTHLLQHQAAAAHFEPMTRPGRTIEEAVAGANAFAKVRACVAVLGMGEDGHVASLFPGMTDLERVFASRHDYASVDASGCLGARNWPRRISLTPHGMARVPTRILVMQGARKRDVFAQALADGNPLRWPVLTALESAHATALQVHWCA